MKIVYPNAVGIHDEDIIEVRVGTGKKSKDHILAVRHRLFGWLDPWAWGVVHHITSLAVRLETDVPNSVAFIGLTFANYAIIRASIASGTDAQDAIEAFLGNKKAQASVENKALWTTAFGLSGYAAVSGSLGGLLSIVVGTVTSGPVGPTQQQKDKIERVMDQFSTDLIALAVSLVAAAIELKLMASLPGIIGAII